MLDKYIGQAVNGLVNTCHDQASTAGWWPDKVNFNVAEKLCLIHSEVSEAMEGVRKDLNDDHLPNRKMVEVELADAVIRIFDLAGAMELDLGGALAEKLEYNKHRADHKPENRELANGKAF